MHVVEEHRRLMVSSLHMLRVIGTCSIAASDLTGSLLAQKKSKYLITGFTDETVACMSKLVNNSEAVYICIAGRQVFFAIYLVHP